MKIFVGLVLIVLLSSCTATRVAQQSSEYPQTFEEAKLWFDEQHSKHFLE